MRRNLELKKQKGKCFIKLSSAKSALVNKCRFALMEAKNNALRKFYGESQVKIVHKLTTDHGFYKKLLVKLIVQVYYF